MAREKEIPADVWKRACDLYLKQRRTAQDIESILFREFKYKISHTTLNKRFNELKRSFDEEEVGENDKATVNDRRHAAKMRRAILGEIDPTTLSNKDKLQLMMDDTFVAFKMAQKDNDVKRMDICLTSFSRGALAIAALERMGLEDGGKNGSPLPGVAIGSKQLGAHHQKEGAQRAAKLGLNSIDPRDEAIIISLNGEEKEIEPVLPRLPTVGVNVGNSSLEDSFGGNVSSDEARVIPLDLPEISYNEARSLAVIDRAGQILSVPMKRG